MAHLLHFRRRRAGGRLGDEARCEEAAADGLEQRCGRQRRHLCAGAHVVYFRETAIEPGV